jgi:hypothetical protein
LFAKAKIICLDLYNLGKNNMERLNENKFKKLSNYQQKMIQGGESTSTCSSDTYSSYGTDMNKYKTDTTVSTWTDMNVCVKTMVYPNSWTK